MNIKLYNILSTHKKKPEQNTRASNIKNYLTVY